MTHLKDSGLRLLVATAALIFFCPMVGTQSHSPGKIRVNSRSYNSPPQTAFRVNTKEVQVKPVVRDTKGMPIGGLTPPQIRPKKEVSPQTQMYTSTLLFFAVAYISCRYAVGIEHPGRWYLATRMKNYNPDPYERPETTKG